MKIVFASTNRKKYYELLDTFNNMDIELIFGGDLPNAIEVKETGKTYRENSLIKAQAWAKLTNMPTIADDSGLEVEGLNWGPGVYSSRITDNDKSAWLLHEMEGEEKRHAAYICCLTIVYPKTNETISCERYCWGTIAKEARGNNGFAYDSVFVPDGYDKTFGELDEFTKRRISHRALAIRNIINDIIWHEDPDADIT